MPWVQLNRNRQGTFRRLVRDTAGNPVLDADGNERWLEFPPRTPIQVAPEDVPTIRGDLGKILMPMEMRCGKLVPLQIDEGEILEAAPESTDTAGGSRSDLAAEASPSDKKPATDNKKARKPKEPETPASEDGDLPGLEDVLNGKVTG